jgi:hypothetical protein
MAVTLLAGTEPSTSNIANNIRDMAGTVFQLEPDAAPLTRLAQAISSKPAINPKVEWNEDEAMPRITTLSASATSGATAFGVTADIFRVNDVVRFTNEGFAIYVTATAAGAVTGAFIGGVAQVSAASNAEVWLVGPSDAEGASLREIKYPQLVTASNYTEIVRTPFGVTGTEQAVTHYGGDERRRLQAKFGVEHARAIEQIFWLGARDIKSTNQRFCGGIIKEFIATNNTAAGGALTEATFQGWLRTGFRYGSERKVMFAAPLVVQAVEGFARANLKVNDNRAETYGVSMKTYVSGQGIVDIVMKRDWNDSTNLKGFAVLIDMDAITYRPLIGNGLERDTKLYQNRQAPDYDGFKDEYLTECSIQVQHERKHALLPLRLSLN